MTPTIRYAEIRDLPNIVRSNAAMADETEDRALDEALLAGGVRALLEDPQKGRYYIAEEEGRFVGQAMITYEWSDWRDGLWWWLQSVYVVPERRRQGVFRALYDRIRIEAQQTQGVVGLRLYVEAENETAQRTYAGLGMAASPYRMFEDEFPC